MATVITTPRSDSGNGMGFLLGVILLIVFAIAFLLYGLPYVANSLQGPQINVPSKLDVNIQNPK